MAAQAGLCLAWSDTPEDTFCRVVVHILGIIVIIFHQSLSRDMTKQTKWVCTQGRLSSAWAFAQSCQSHRCRHEESLGLSTHWAHSEDADQTGQMPRLIWVFAGRTLTLLVLSCHGSFVDWFKVFFGMCLNGLNFCVWSSGKETLLVWR